jgi:hypothetical protein
MIDIEQAHPIGAEPGTWACIKHAHGARRANSAFQKYNSTIGQIGFPPTRPIIINKSGNLDALNNYGSLIRVFSKKISMLFGFRLIF